MRILIADDDPVPRRMLQAILKKWDYEVVLADNGAEAWEILQGDNAPQIAILDWLMPEMDGVEVCRRMRQRTDAPLRLLHPADLQGPEGRHYRGHGGGRGRLPDQALRDAIACRSGCAPDGASWTCRPRCWPRWRSWAARAQREVEIGARIQQTLLLGQPPQRCSGRGGRGADHPLAADRRRFLRLFPAHRSLPGRHCRRRHGQGRARRAVRRGDQEPLPARDQPPALLRRARRRCRSRKRSSRPCIGR